MSELRCLFIHVHVTVTLSDVFNLSRVLLSGLEVVSVSLVVTMVIKHWLNEFVNVNVGVRDLVAVLSSLKDVLEAVLLAVSLWVSDALIKILREEKS